MRISDWSSDVCSSDLIRVNALVPGAVRTPMLQRAMDNDAGLEPYLNSIHTIGRYSAPHEQAQAALWLLYAEASFIPDSSLAADGGLDGSGKYYGAGTQHSTNMLATLSSRRGTSAKK